MERYGVEEREGIRSILGRRWVPDEKIWTIPYSIAAIESLLEAYRSCEFECDERLNKELPYIREWLDRWGAQVNAVLSSSERGNGIRIDGNNCAMHWWQGVTAARRLKLTYRKRNAFSPICKGPKQV
ncbi:hypothetical protein [Paenibacillus sp. Aloe-11]|uniref:hypothetical protein n=1 Tax=Paenibacillus sp. Aloe-11 TaxID=1050222 RepID=UPI001E3560CE|nr:hypothetical protein [Paenibacillus sp. Aloe-11]